MNTSIKDIFKRSIKNGTGKAVLILMQNPSVDVGDLVLGACTNNLAYDPQCEGSRANYLFELISLSANKTTIEKAVIDKLLDAKSDDWDTSLLFDLAKCLAANGNKEAEEAIYKRYSSNIDPEYEYVDTGVLVELDGVDGLAYSAEITGKYLEIDTDFWVNNWLLSVCTEFYPDSLPKEHLIEKSRSSDNIKAYLESMEETEALSSTKRRMDDWSYFSVSELIRSGKPVPVYVGRKLECEDLLKLSDDFRKEHNEKNVEAYLRVFSRAKCPGDISHIIPHLESNNERIANYAVSTLSNLQDPLIRRVIDGHDIGFLKDRVRLFTNNYRSEDIDVLVDMVDSLKNDDEIHSFVSDVIKVFENNTINRPSLILNKLYEINNCSICRLSMLKVLISAGDLSTDILRELEYDCDEDIRELFHE